MRRDSPQNEPSHPRCLRFALALVVMGCGGAEAPVLRAVGVATPPAADEAEPAPGDVRGELHQLVVARAFIRMHDCGHDGAVGELHCGYSVAGEARPAPLDRRLQLFLTEPPGFVLAAVDWEPARALGDGAATTATCDLELRGELRDVHFGAAQGITGYRYLGSLPVGVATACDFAPHLGIAEQLRASHLLVSHADATRAPANVTRSRDEAAQRAADVAARLDAKELSFAEAVDAYSDEPGAKQRRGHLGSFSPETVVPEFALVVLATPSGARSAAFETTFGFHVLERHPPE